jgi:TRAP-type C4-dicarboxylate transport system permease small subunit
MNPKPIRPQEWIAAILLSSMSVIAFVNVLSRYFFHFSFAATEEITINMFVWLTVIGSGIAFERGGHLGVVTCFNLFPPRMQKGVIFFGAILNAALFVWVDIYLIQAIYFELKYFHASSGALNVPIWIYYAGVPVLSVFVFTGIYKDARQKLERMRGAD